MTDTIMTDRETSVLLWLSTEDGQYGECRGPTLDGLIAKGYAVIGGPETGINNNFIAKGYGIMYRTVSITDAGRAALASGEAT
jgi:hypothetical protein